MKLLTVLLFIVTFIQPTLAQCPLDIDETTVAPTNNLLLHLPFDGNLTNLGSGNYTITNNGAQYVPTQCGQGLFFDGVNDFVNVSPSMNLVNDFTVCTWISPSSQVDWMGIFSIREQCATTYRGYSILQFNLGDYNVNTLNNQVNIHQNCTGFSAGDRYTNTGILIPNNSETFVALTVQNNSSENRVVKLYVNCAEYSTTMTIDFPTAVCFNGTQNYTTTVGASSGVTNHTSTFHGIIDQLRVYDVVLNHEQILDVYQSCLPVSIDVTEFPDCNADSAQITIFNTELDVNYQLINTSTNTPVGPLLPGNCGPLVFNTGIYTSTTQFQIAATNTVSSCSIMLDSTITLSPSVNNYTSTQNVTLCAGDSIQISSGYITSAGTYTDTIPVSSTCDSIITLNVTEITPYALDLGPDIQICPNVTQTLTIPPGANSYLWQDGSTFNSYQITQAGSYWVDVTDQCGTYSDTIVVSSPLDTLDLGPDTSVCQGAYLVLDATMPSATYLWNDNSTGATNTVAMSGTYWVEVNVSNCIFTDSVDILVELSPSVVLGNDTTICDGDVVSLLASAQNASDYLWSTGDISSSIDVSSPAQYLVEVSNQCGTDSDTLLLSVNPTPSINLGNDTTICEGSTFVLDAFVPSSNYLWQDNSTNSSITVNSAGIYWVEVSAGNCNEVDSIVVSEVQAPFISLGNDTIICEGNDLLIYPSTQQITSYLWSTNETSSNITVSQAGTYWLQGTNACGTATDSIDVFVETLPIFDLGNDTTLCTGATLLLTANVPNTTTTWQDGSQLTTFTVTQAGIYTAVVNGQVCIYQDDIVLAYSDVPDLTLGEDTIICEGDQVFLTASSSNGSLLWNNGSQEPTIVINEAGVYSVTSTNNCGQSSDQIEIQSQSCSCELYIPNSFTPDDGKFNENFGPVHECEILEYSFRIFNRWGEVIFESTDSQEVWDGTYLDKKVPVGTYTYQLTYSTENEEGIRVMGHVNVLY